MPTMTLHKDGNNYYPETKAKYVAGALGSRTKPFCAFYAHRGLSNSYPENTMPAFIAAVQAGYKYIETDIVQSSDGVQFLLHDSTIDRTSNGTGAASSFTATQLKSYDFGYPSKFGNTFAGTKIPTLEEFLVFCKKNGIICEFDISDDSRYNNAMLRTTYDLVKSYNMLDATYFCATTSRLEALQQIDDSVMVSVSGMTSASAISNAAHLLDNSRQGNYSVPYQNYSQAMVFAAHNNGGEIKVWTIDSTTTANSVFNDGAEFILSNSIEPDSFDWLQ